MTTCLEAAGHKKVAIYGYRDLSAQKFTTRWGNRFLTFVTNVLYGSRIHDMETCYKMIPAEGARALPMEGRRCEIEPEITACVLQAGYKIFEVPISYAPRKEKKLHPWKDGWPALAMLFYRRMKKFSINTSAQSTGITSSESPVSNVQTKP